VPDTIRHLVARQSDRLSPTDHTTLAAASVAGMEFSAASVAAALVADTGSVEYTCEQLANQQQFLQRLGIEEWPDGTLAARYRDRYGGCLSCSAFPFTLQTRRNETGEISGLTWSSSVPQRDKAQPSKDHFDNNRYLNGEDSRKTATET
jgi:hypothetical protein